MLAFVMVLLVLTGAPRDAVSDAQPQRGAWLGGLLLKAGLEVSSYSDSDHVEVFTPVLSASVESPLGGWSVGGRYLVDAVTAASSDIVATASPRFREVRHAAAASASYKPGDIGGAGHASISVEPDYLSISAGANATWEIAQKNLVLLAGYTYGHDTIGRARTAFAVFHRELERHTITAGSTWVVGRATLMSLIGDVIVERGDQSKPYRYIPLFAPGRAVDIPAGASFAVVHDARADERPLESLPLARDRFSVMARFAHRLRDSTLRIEERLYIDTWGLKASTTDLRYIFEVTPRLALWPHVRGHLQTGVDFWQRAYELIPHADGSLMVPSIRTGDRELGPLHTLTSGGGGQIDLSGRPGARRWVLTLQADGVFTRYLDALYLTSRSALFTAISLDATFD